MSTPPLRRRLEAAEIASGVTSAHKIAVLHRPYAMDADTVAAWEMTEAAPRADLIVTVLCMIAWPPRTEADVQANLNASKLHRSAEDLAVKVRNLPDYPEKASVLALLPAISLH